MAELDKIFSKSKRIKITDESKFIIMSDCHRGAGNNYDNFIRNENIFKSALNHYYKNGYTYVELGDGDDMWEVKNYQDIVDEHLESFLILKKFHEKKRLFMILGNHDLCKKNKKVLAKYFYTYYKKSKKENIDLLNNLKVKESLVLEYKDKEIFLVHGHQVDFLNNKLWRLSRFLVRYIWGFLEKLGIKDPTSAAKNNSVSNKVERKLKAWSSKNHKIIIAGHTHRPSFPEDGSLYFNDGSCIHPSGITGIEIKNGEIALVKWKYEVDNESKIIVNKSYIERGVKIDNIF